MINLLPENQQRKLARIKQIKLINICGFLALLVVLTLTLSAFALSFYLQGELVLAKAVQESASMELTRTDNTQLKRQLLELNRKLTEILDFENSYQPASALFKELALRTPLELSYNSLLYEQSDGKVTLTGLAKLRETLLQFKTALESSDKFSQVDFPASNWVKAAQVSFFVSFKYANSANH